MATASSSGTLQRDPEQAIVLNRRYADSLGWRISIDAIVTLLGFSGFTPDERTFADAVTRWQQANGLPADGIIGPGTWRTMQQRLSGNVSVARQTGASGFFKDIQRLALAQPALAVPVVPDKRWDAQLKRMAQTYNRLGGLMRALADETRTEVPAILGVWQVESGGFPHIPGKAIIRFENHLLYRGWGRQNDELYGRHFRYGGYRGLSGAAWENHQFRTSDTDNFLPQHDRKLTFQQNQEREYATLRLAISKAGPEPALLSISIGGPQLLVANFRMLGYGTPMEMYEAFQADERSHILGFFDFCNQKKTPGGNLLTSLRKLDWREFARYYNGPGQVETYAKWLMNAHENARKLTA